MRRILISLACIATTVGIAIAQTAPAPTRIAYGPEPTSFGELLVPPGQGPFPVVMLLHGGCWLAKGGSAESMRPMAAMLATHGIASWNVEYRRVGHSGGGWPGTYTDLSTATDYLADLAPTHPIDLRRVILAGHSSGGYFAAWIAGRHRLPAGSPLTGSVRVKPAGMVLLDAFIDPGVIDSKGVNGDWYCGEEILPRLIGGDQSTAADRLKQASPLAGIPFGIPQEYVVSSRRYPVTPQRPLADGRTTFAVADYPALARAAGDSVDISLVPDADHFDFTKPGTRAWSALEAAFVHIAGTLTKASSSAQR